MIRPYLRQYLLLALTLCTPTINCMAHDAQAPSSITQLPLERVSERIHIVYGTQQLPNPASRGFMNNPAAI
ncbi:MAG: hypothetical protein JSW10_12240 [Pseudomonadota bacterium]|nr:MAG: hypothetical protein JSW10_12240 [Pseudomonadota bacterium]